MIEVSAIGKPAFRASRTITHAVVEDGKVVLKCGFMNVRSYDCVKKDAEHVQAQVAKAIEQKGHILISGDSYYVATNKVVAVARDIAQRIYHALVTAYGWVKVKVLEAKDWIVVQYKGMMARIDLYKRAFVISREFAKNMTKEQMEAILAMAKNAGLTTEVAK